MYNDNYLITAASQELPWHGHRKGNVRGEDLKKHGEGLWRRREWHWVSTLGLRQDWWQQTGYLGGAWFPAVFSIRREGTDDDDLITESEVVTGKSQTEVWDFPVTTERSRLLSCLLYGQQTGSKETKNLNSRREVVTSGDARVYLFIHLSKSSNCITEFSELTCTPSRKYIYFWKAMINTVAKRILVQLCYYYL